MIPAAAHAQSAATAQIGDPKKCVVVVEEMKGIGFRIGDAQMVAEALLTGLRKRVGQEGAIFEGAANSTGKLNSLLGKSIEGGSIQDAQIQYYKQCISNAPWRVHAKLVGKKGLEVTCRKVGIGDKPDLKATPADSRKFDGKTFVESRDKLVEAVPSFCMQIPDTAAQIPLEPPPNLGNGPQEPPGMSKKKAVKGGWTPPPRRD